MRRIFAVVLAAGFALTMVGASVAQDSKLGTRSVTGTVKSATSDGIVVLGREQDKEREWAFKVDGSTVVQRGTQKTSAAALKAGDKVKVDYTEREGKVIAQSVTVGDAARPTTR